MLQVNHFVQNPNVDSDLKKRNETVALRETEFQYQNETDKYSIHDQFAYHVSLAKS